MGRLAYRLRKPLVSLAATLVALVAAEFVIRALGMAPAMQAIRLEDAESPYQRSTNPILRYELRPGFRAELQPQHKYLRTRRSAFGLGTTSATTGAVSVNAHGLRDKERSLEKPPGVRRIVLLGDSVVELVNYVSDDATISRRLEELFDDGTEVLNCATSGFCTRGEVELLKQKALAFQPDLVMLVFVENDFWDLNLEHTLDGGIADRPRAVERLFESSHFFRLACLQLNLFHFADELDPAAWHRRAMGDNNVVSGFQLLNELSRQHDFDVIVTVWPSFTKDGIEDRNFVPGSDELVVERLAWSNGFPTVRLAPHFRRRWQALGQPLEPAWYFTNGDGMHPSPEGCQIAAEILHEILVAPDQAAVGLQQPDLRAVDPRRDELAIQAARALTLEPEEPLPMQERIDIVLRRQNRSIEAEHYVEQLASLSDEDFVEAFGNKPDLLQELHQVGVGFFEAGQMYAAKDVFQRAVSVSPEHVPSHYYLGLTSIWLNEWEHARDALKRVVQLDARHGDAHRQLANVYWQLEDEPRAVEHYRLVFERTPATDRDRLRMAWFLSTAEDPQVRDGREALRLAEQAVANLPEPQSYPCGVVAACHAELGDFEAAVQWQSRALEAAPPEEKEVLAARLEIYRGGRPYRRNLRDE